MCYNVVVRNKGAYKIMEKLELTLENVKKIKNESNRALIRYVCGYVIDKWDKYDDKNDIFLDVMKFGCVSGVVEELTYCIQTKRFYQTYKYEINELIWKSGWNNLADLFGSDWDPYDPLVLEGNNQNLLAWFGFEETLNNIAYKFGIE